MNPIDAMSTDHKQVRHTLEELASRLTDEQHRASAAGPAHDVREPGREQEMPVCAASAR